VQKVKETEKEGLETSFKQNGFWLGALQTAQILGWDPVSIIHRTERTDTLTAENMTLAKALQDEMAKLGANPDGGRMLALIRPRLEQAQKNLQRALDAAKLLLSEEQWNYLPERLKTPRGIFGGGERRRPDD